MLIVEQVQAAGAAAARAEAEAAHAEATVLAERVRELTSELAVRCTQVDSLMLEIQVRACSPTRLVFTLGPGC